MLKRHPLNAKFMPEPAVHSPEWGSFKIGMDAAGPEGIPPLVITKDGLIIKGKRRWLAARELQWTKVPCVVRDEAEAALIMMDSLLGQRSLQRGNKAYICILMIKEYISSAEHRRFANLKRGAKTIEKPILFPKAHNEPSGVDLSNPEIADRIGVSIATFKRAASIYRLFYDPKCDGWREIYKNHQDACPKLEVLRELQAKWKAEMEPEILSGERTITQVLQAVSGSLEEFQKKPKGQEQPELDLWGDSLGALRDAAPKWSKLSEENREWVLKQWRLTVRNLPEELQEALREELV